MRSSGRPASVSSKPPRVARELRMAEMMATEPCRLSCATSRLRRSAASPWKFVTIWVSFPPVSPAKNFSLWRNFPRSWLVIFSVAAFCSAMWSSAWKRRCTTCVPEFPALGRRLKPSRHALSACCTSSRLRSRTREPAHSTEVFAAEGWKVPLKGFTVLNLLGSARSMFASSCPAPTIAPGPSSWWIFPVAVELRDMIIFIASSSAKGSPSATSAPSWCRYRTSFPLKSDRSSEGSRITGNMMVEPPSMRSRSPRGSSMPAICTTRSPVFT
mmetsp:Transcript_68059/g.191849  ORF Transcript_68059/g.191849 Transcript_68059/m.191849 type:complete len:271 (+) Transcript_68059:3756-4568(+)